MTGYFAFPPTSDDGFARPTHERVPFSNIQERQPDASNAPSLDDLKLDEEKKAHVAASETEVNFIDGDTLRKIRTKKVRFHMFHHFDSH